MIGPHEYPIANRWPNWNAHRVFSGPFSELLSAKPWFHMSDSLPSASANHFQQARRRPWPPRPVIFWGWIIQHRRISSAGRVQ